MPSTPPRREPRATPDNTVAAEPAERLQTDRMNRSSFDSITIMAFFGRYSFILFM